jgi:sulfonate transport system substrate-binding protein
MKEHLTIAALLTGAVALAASTVTVATAAPAVASKPNLSGVTLVFGQETAALEPEIAASGVLKGAPYKVQYVTVSGPAAAGAAMLAGDTDGTIDDGDSGAAVLQAADSQPWTAANAQVRVVALEKEVYPDLVTIATTKSGITKLCQVKGHTFAYDPGAIIETQYLMDLVSCHLTQSDVKPVVITAATLQSTFASGAVDVESSALSYAVPDVANGTARIIATQKQVGLLGDGSVIATHATLANPAKKAALTDFLARYAEFDAWYGKHLSTVTNILESDLDVAPADAPDQAKYGTVYLSPTTPAILKYEQKIANLEASAGMISHQINITPGFDTSFNSVITAADAKYGIPTLAELNKKS